MWMIEKFPGCRKFRKNDVVRKIRQEKRNRAGPLKTCAILARFLKLSEK